MLITTRLIHLPKSQGYTHSLQLEKHSKGGKRSLSPPHQPRRVSSTVNRPGATASGWHLRADWNLPELCSCFLVWLVRFCLGGGWFAQVLLVFGITTCRILALRPGLELVPPAVEAHSATHWTARKSPVLTSVTKFLHLLTRSLSQ